MLISNEKQALPPEPTVEYRCTDGCGAAVSVPATQYPPGWIHLPISKRWRCPACVAELAIVNRYNPNEDGK